MKGGSGDNIKQVFSIRYCRFLFVNTTRIKIDAAGGGGTCDDVRVILVY